MHTTLKELKDAASNLSLDERAELANFILRSLDESEVEWTRADSLALAEQRLDELHSGKAVGIPAEEVMKSLLKPRQ